MKRSLAEPPSTSRPATVVVGGWTVASRPGRVWLHHARPGADGDLAPAAAEALAAALQRAAVEARRGPDRSWTPPERRPPCPPHPTLDGTPQGAPPQGFPPDW